MNHNTGWRRLCRTSFSSQPAQSKTRAWHFLWTRDCPKVISLEKFNSLQVCAKTTNNGAETTILVMVTKSTRTGRVLQRKTQEKSFAAKCCCTSHHFVHLQTIWFCWRFYTVTFNVFLWFGFQAELVEWTTDWRFWMKQQSSGCATPAPRSTAAKQWAEVKELVQTMITVFVQRQLYMDFRD